MTTVKVKWVVRLIVKIWVVLGFVIVNTGFLLVAAAVGVLVVVSRVNSGTIAATVARA